MRNVNELYPRLRWAATSPLDVYEPDDFVYEVSGEVLGTDDEEGCHEVLMGKFRLYYVDGERAVNDGVSVGDTMDAHSDHVSAYFAPLFGVSAPEFERSVYNALLCLPQNSNLLILDRVELLPEFRGQRLGLKVIKHVIRRFGNGASVVALKPYPLQFEYCRETSDWRKKMGLKSLESDRAKARRKLVTYYASIGFLELPKTPYMIFSPDMRFADEPYEPEQS